MLQGCLEGDGGGKQEAKVQKVEECCTKLHHKVLWLLDFASKNKRTIVEVLGGACFVCCKGLRGALNCGQQLVEGIPRLVSFSQTMSQELILGMFARTMQCFVLPALGVCALFILLVTCGQATHGSTL